MAINLSKIDQQKKTVIDKKKSGIGTKLNRMKNLRISGKTN